MKNLADIRELVEVTHKKTKEHIEKCIESEKAAIFFQYDRCKEIKELLNNVENCKGGKYFLSMNDNLCYGVELEGLKTLPYIREYMKQERDHVWMEGNTVCQRLGDYIAVNYHYSDHALFVYDSGTMKPIIEERNLDGHPDITEETYVKAKIELYMRERGEFNDVIQLDEWGSYEKHFETFSDEQNDEYLKHIVETYENYEGE